MEQEGVIKFSMQHNPQPLLAARYAERIAELIAWRGILRQLGLVGQQQERYEGAGFGNLSARVGPFPGRPGQRPFLITGTQTGGVLCMGLEHHSLVLAHDLGRNAVVSQGSVAPSSESMTHGAIYDLNPAIRFVFHAHCPTLWRQAERLGLPQTRAEVPYGTVAMAREVRRLYQSTQLPEGRIFSMKGHEDGIVVFGTTAAGAGQVLVQQLARAYTVECGQQASLCL